MKAELTDTTMTLHLFKRVEGQSVPCKLVIERGTSQILSYACQERDGSTPIGGLAGVLQGAAKLNIPTSVEHTSAGARVRVVAGDVSDRMRTTLMFFQLDTPCSFPGCEMLRAQYAKEVAELPPNCPLCEQGKIMRKYMQMLEPILNAHATHPEPRTIP